MKIGIPRSLFTSYHLVYWTQFITFSGMEAILSDESSKEIAAQGGRLLPHEFCIPVKVFIGHVLNLMEKGVDQILVPRMTTQGKANYFCPKLIGLPEIVHYATGLGEERLFSPEIICDGLQLRVTTFPASSSAVLRRMKAAAKQANECWERILSDCRKQKITLLEASGGKGTEQPGACLNIGLLGYAYSLYDPFISKGILRKLYQLGVAVTTWEMLNPVLIEGNLVYLKRPIFWNFSRMILGAGLYFLEDSEIDGLIYVSTFGCGPDSVTTKILTSETCGKYKPLLQINLDEHTEDGHLMTRLEAFVDMLITLKEDKAI